MPTGNTDPEGKPAVCVMAMPGQLSVATGGSQLTVAPHDPGVLKVVMFNGHEVKTGISTSLTFTVNEHMAVLPAASVAV